MRVRVIGAGAATGSGFPLSTFLIDGVLAVDAGALGWFADPPAQAAVRDILLTHAHIDHVAGLPIFLDNVYGLATEPPNVRAIPDALDALQSHLFNDVLMPDFVKLSETLRPFLRQVPIRTDTPFAVGGYTVTAIPVDHTIPTVAYLIDDGETAVAIVTDTAPVPAVWARLAVVPRLRGVFLEASFPDSEAALASVSKHLTTSEFLAAASTFPAGVQIFAIHIKPRFASEIIATIRSACRPRVRVAVPGEEIVFS